MTFSNGAGFNRTFIVPTFAQTTAAVASRYLPNGTFVPGASMRTTELVASSPVGGLRTFISPTSIPTTAAIPTRFLPNGMPFTSIGVQAFDRITPTAFGGTRLFTGTAGMFPFGGNFANPVLRSQEVAFAYRFGGTRWFTNGFRAFPFGPTNPGVITAAEAMAPSFRLTNALVAQSFGFTPATRHLLHEVARMNYLQNYSLAASGGYGGYGGGSYGGGGYGGVGYSSPSLGVYPYQPVASSSLDTTGTASPSYSSPSGSGGTPVGPAPQSGSAEPAKGIVPVAIQDSGIQPTAVTIASGATVRWTNETRHAVTFTWGVGGPPAPNSLDEGKTYSYTFTKPGTYAYYCTVAGSTPQNFYGMVTVQ